MEQFSITSDDSIWSEPEPTNNLYEDNHFEENHMDDFSDSPNISTERVEFHEDIRDTFVFKDSLVSNECNESQMDELPNAYKALPSPLLLSKWLESAARFQPSEANYACWADGRRKRPEGCSTKVFSSVTWMRRDRSEVEAAMALTTLAAATSPLSAL